MRTPEKIPVHKTLDECRELVFSRVDTVHAEYTAKGWLPARLNLNAGIVRGLLELFAWVLYAFYTFLARSLPNAFPLEAEADWLDLHGGQVELSRRAFTRTEGNVRFGRAEDGGTGNIRIPAGRVVRTRPDGRGAVYRFVTLMEVILTAGEDSVLAPVRAEEYGQASNVTAGQICEIVTHIPGIGSVSNEADWLTSEGADAETDAQLQARYVLAWLELAGCTASAYQSWALSVPGVMDAKVIDDHPRGEGTLDIVIRGSAGQPTETLLEKVRVAVAEKASVNDKWEVKGPIDVPVAVDVVAEIIAGTTEAGQLAVENRIRALFAGSGSGLDDVAAFGVGEDFTRDRVVAASVGKIAGLKRLVWNSPAELVAVTKAGLASMASLKVIVRVVDA